MGGSAGDHDRGARLIARRVRPLTDADRPRLRRLLASSWGSTGMASRGRLHEIGDLPGFVAELDGEWLGHAAYHIEGAALEVALLESLVERVGAGSALLAACVERAHAKRLGRVWLVTTNDNTVALQLPQLGRDGIALRDELELELPADDWPELVERHAWPTT